ncbi:MAG: phosphoribosylanthranilate isomerase [Mucilaginibacter sp.]|nr:phosphoribosylanthranilate isomerase [Mucilaginibacter sp.]
MKIKVCGLKFTENIEAVAALNPDFMGFIFYDRSPRFIDEVPGEALKNLPYSIIKTAVFVNETTEIINALIDQYHFNAVQLHGNESPDFCNSFRDKVKVIKAFGMSEDFNLNQLIPYADKVDYFLFDTKTDIHGGSGKTFNWSVLDQYQLNIPFFLSGGLSLDNLDEIKKIRHPQFYGADLNSKFEVAPGNKNIEQLEKAFDIIKQSKTNEVRS